MKKKWQRLAAIALCAAMVSNTTGFSVLADIVDKDPQVVESTVELSENILYQKADYGTKLSELNLPDKIKVTVLGGGGKRGSESL